MREKTSPYTKFIYNCYLININIKKLLTEEKRKLLNNLKNRYDDAENIVIEYRKKCFNIWLIAESFKNFYNKSDFFEKRYIANICIGKKFKKNPNLYSREKLFERLKNEISKNNISK